MNLKTELSNIQKKIAVRKTSNRGIPFKSRSAEMILKEAKELMSDGTVLTLSDEIISVGESLFIQSTATLATGDEEIKSVGLAGHAKEKRGLDAAQVSGLTSSYARKYALGGLFALDDGEDADTQPQRTSVAMPTKKSYPPPSATKLVTEGQLKRMFAIAKKHNKLTDLKDLIKSVAGVDSSKDLTMAAYEEVIKRIES